MSTPTSVPSALGDGPATIEPGRLVAGRYLLLAPVGRGGSGSVWRAHDELLDRDVAIKRLHGGRALDDARARLVRERAYREGRVAARLHHPRLAAIFDMTELDGEICLVMEYVAAPSLADVLDRDGPMPPARVAAIGAQIAEGLAAMHQRGIVHRDVKPANVMLGAGDAVTVTDFGIAVVGTDPGTGDHLVVGTPHYMAPELARGEAATAAADVFSLGATLYTALEGAPPAGDGGNALEVLSRVAAGVVRPTRHAGGLAPVLRALLGRDPDRRPSAATAARLLARDAVGGEAVDPGVVAPRAAVGAGVRAVTPLAVRARSCTPDLPDAASSPDTATSLEGAPRAVPPGVAQEPGDDLLPSIDREPRTGPVPVPLPAATTRPTPLLTRVARRTTRRVVAVGVGIAGVLGAAGLVAASTGTGDPAPVTPQPALASPLAATPLPAAAPPVVPPDAATADASTTTAPRSTGGEAVASTARDAGDEGTSAGDAADAWEAWRERLAEAGRQLPGGGARGGGHGDGHGGGHGSGHGGGHGR